MLKARASAKRACVCLARAPGPRRGTRIPPHSAGASAPVIKPELLDELLKLTKDPKALFGAQGVLQQLKGALTERILEAELTEDLGYESGAAQGRGSGNSRNGHTRKTVTTESGPVDISVPRDRAGTFEPQLVPKHARRLEDFDEHVLSLYGRGMPMREIQEHLRHLYGTEISPDPITRVTDAVLEDAREWQTRPLEPVYPVLYIDALFTSVKLKWKPLPPGSRP